MSTVRALLTALFLATPCSLVIAQAASAPTPEVFGLAVKAGDVVAVKRHIAAGYNVNKVTGGIPSLGIPGSSAVSDAAGYGQCEVLDVLLKAGGVADIKSMQHGFTPLALAAQKGAPSCVKLLLDRGARLDIRTEPGGDTAIILAAYQGHFEVIRLLVEAGASLTVANKDGDTPYRAARVYGNSAIATYIKEKGGR